MPRGGVCDAGKEKLSSVCLVESSFDVLSISPGAFHARENGHLSCFIAPHILLTTTRLGLHDASPTVREWSPTRGRSRGTNVPPGEEGSSKAIVGPVRSGAVVARRISLCVVRDDFRLVVSSTAGESIETRSY
jgi:hypothetical protein